MKIQSLAIMFIILILPISIILGNYTRNRVETLSLQTQYDSKLKDATYDALKAYQINSFNSDTSMYVNSKMRDIKASVNTFFNSLGTNFSSVGYTKETLQSYVPAVVYTMYDGYYIYSPYKNTWDTSTFNEHKGDTSYEKGESLYGLKPYVYYSCRYKKSNLDIVITYSLDNYISIQGLINGEPVSKYGYLLSGVEKNGENIKYNGIQIDEENDSFIEKIYVEGTMYTLPCIKRNGTKYYIEGSISDPRVFSIINGQKIIQSGISASDFNVKSAKDYYKDAYDLKDFISNNSYLRDLKVSDAVNVNGSEFQSLNGGKIFDYDYTDGIESSNSNFNTHRFDVIKYSIEKNLSIAITNYNNYSGASANFQMPKLKDTDWEKIMDNVSIISFLQGMSIGGKIYNGYSVITNNKNEDVVMEDSIYIKMNENSEDTLHRITESGLEGKIKANPQGGIGVLNVDTERRKTADLTKYYYPIYGKLSYDSIITQNCVESYTTLKGYFQDKPELAKIYYTALGRERYGMYRPKIDFNKYSN